MIKNSKTALQGKRVSVDENNESQLKLFVRMVNVFNADESLSHRSKQSF